MSDDRTMSAREAAALVGVSASRLRRLYPWNLPYTVAPDGSRRYRLVDVLDYMARSGRIAAGPPAEDQLDTEWHESREG